MDPVLCSGDGDGVSDGYAIEDDESPSPPPPPLVLFGPPFRLFFCRGSFSFLFFEVLRPASASAASTSLSMTTVVIAVVAFPASVVVIIIVAFPLFFCSPASLAFFTLPSAGR